MSKEARKLADQNGGVWGVHPKHSPDDWRQEVYVGDTRSSYWDWCIAKDEMDAE